MQSSLSAAEDALVYVRKVAIDDLPDAVQEEAREGGLEELYALHRADGEQVALVGDRRMAFSLALQNDMQPVSVH
ncbi:MAG: DUF1150 family protein [Pseudomonadota bacterium]